MPFPQLAGPCAGPDARRARLTKDPIAREGPTVAGSEPVTSPDQHKPGHRKAGQIGAVLSALALLAMICGNHEGRVEDIWLIGLAALLLIIVIGDIVLRRSGLRS
ncbi:DUF2631 domain-containing protein [Micromonospora sp. M51]|nr:DUF2631 domain-containing protein [Micromonospora sp. M51]MBQ1031516.1 DUF2631 domain-containing protein [Micromonospora sp. C97]